MTRDSSSSSAFSTFFWLVTAAAATDPKLGHLFLLIFCSVLLLPLTDLVFYHPWLSLSFFLNDNNIVIAAHVPQRAKEEEEERDQFCRLFHKGSSVSFFSLYVWGELPFFSAIFYLYFKRVERMNECDFEGCQKWFAVCVFRGQKSACDLNKKCCSWF